MFFVFVKKKKLLIISSIILACILLITIILKSGIISTFSESKKRELPIYCVKTDEKKIAISFDCAWGVEYTDGILDVMKKENVKSTFFAVEFWTVKYPDYIKKISDYGHEIGTHSATHPYMSKLSKTDIEKELNTSSSAIENITGKKVDLFRAPYGDYDDLLITTARDLGFFTIQWDVDSIDWKNISREDIKKRVLNKVKNGSIVLFHNNGLHTLEALPDIITSLKQQGFSFVTIGELIYRDNFTIAFDGTQIPIT